MQIDVMTRMKCNRLCEISDNPFIVAQHTVSRPPKIIEKITVWFEFDGFGEVSNNLVIVTQFEMNTSSAFVDPKIIFVKFDGSGVFFNSPFPFPLLPVCR